MNEGSEIGLIQTLGYFLEIKVLGSRDNPSAEALREKLETMLAKTKTSDGSTQMKVSELELMYEIPYPDFDGIKIIAKKRIKKKR